MELITKQIMETIPPLYSQELVGEGAHVAVKFFSIISDWRWYATEASPIVLVDGNEVQCESYATAQAQGLEIVDWMFFGLVDGMERELGYFTLRQLESVKGPGGIAGIERDMYFEENQTLESVRGTA